MTDPAAQAQRLTDHAARFGLAPPRRFVLPAILLVLSEGPGHGYSLQKDLEEFRLGHIDRPSVYRALAQLESDGLVESWAGAPKTGQQRRVYGITGLGEQVLRVWMRVIKDERDCLGRVLRRYRATGTADAVLAEVEGGWAAPLGFGWSPVSSTSSTPRGLVVLDATPPADRSVADHDEPASNQPPTAAVCRHFTLVPERSVVLIDVRSTVGPISFGAMGITGSVDAEVADGGLRPTSQPSAVLSVRLDGLRSGNGVYDAELLRRIDARRFPTATIQLRECVATPASGHYHVVGDLTFHGVTRSAEGTVTVTSDEVGGLTVTGEQVFDIRDFRVPSPTVLMLRMYPDVRVRLHIEARIED